MDSTGDTTEGFHVKTWKSYVSEFITKTYKSRVTKKFYCIQGNNARNMTYGSQIKCIY